MNYHQDIGNNNSDIHNKRVINLATANFFDGAAEALIISVPLFGGDSIPIKYVSIDCDGYRSLSNVVGVGHV